MRYLKSSLKTAQRHKILSVIFTDIPITRFYQRMGNGLRRWDWQS